MSVSVFVTVSADFVNPVADIVDIFNISQFRVVSETDGERYILMMRNR